MNAMKQLVPNERRQATETFPPVWKNSDERRSTATSYNVHKNSTINRAGCFFFIRGLKLPALLLHFFVSS